MSVLSYTYGVKTRFCFIFFLIFMKTEKRFFNSYVFLRRYFNISKGKRLRWCVIRESSAKGTELRLGVSVAGTNKYIDIAQRRIFSETSSGLIDRCVFPARRSCFGKNYVYTTENGWSITKPKDYIMDVYRSSWWRPGITERERFL